VLIDACCALGLRCSRMRVVSACATHLVSVCVCIKLSGNVRVRCACVWSRSKVPTRVVVTSRFRRQARVHSYFQATALKGSRGVCAGKCTALCVRVCAGCVCVWHQAHGGRCGGRGAVRSEGIVRALHQRRAWNFVLTFSKKSVSDLSRLHKLSAEG
jgi:hypothetical protein